MDLLNSIGNGYALIKSKNFNIKFDKASFDQKNSIIKADGNIKLIC